MSQGIWINGQRPKSKKAIREAVESDPGTVRVESTSLFGNEYNGFLDVAPEGTMVVFCGPDPFRNRKFYGTITKFNDELHVV
jgi:hypothetical protein